MERAPGLPPFSPLLARCAKCGHDDIAVHYCDGTRSSYFDPCPRGEHLHRRCKRCGFRWCEATVETAPSESVAEGLARAIKRAAADD